VRISSIVVVAPTIATVITVVPRPVASARVRRRSISVVILLVSIPLVIVLPTLLTVIVLLTVPAAIVVVRVTSVPTTVSAAVT